MLERYGRYEGDKKRECFYAESKWVSISLYTPTRCMCPTATITRPMFMHASQACDFFLSLDFADMDLDPSSVEASSLFRFLSSFLSFFSFFTFRCSFVSEADDSSRPAESVCSCSVKGGVG